MRSGFEVDIIRREAGDDDPHPLRLIDDENDFSAVQAKRAGVLLSAPPFSTMIASPAGYMARMHTVSPLNFIQFKQWMALQSTRDRMKTGRDAMQAELVAQLVGTYLPHLFNPQP